MNKRSLHLISVALLLLWSAVLLYFHVSGRVQHYLPPDGLFRPMVLIAGIGLAILALFNLATMHSETTDCCGHDHDHAAAKEAECCDHDHSQKNHHHHTQSHDCGHDHSQDRKYAAHDHGHGILEESGLVGRLVAITIIAAPLAWAAVRTPDQYSPNAIINKGLYHQNYASTARADQFSLKKEADKTQAKPKAAPTDLAAPSSTPDSARTPGSASTAATAASTTAPAPTAAKSYGSFSLEDLKAQVPMSKEGNFILDVPEIYYTAGDKEVQTVLAGQPVETIAQVLPEKVNNEEGKRLRIFRMLVQCCAADARPYSIPAQFAEKAPDFKDMAWVKIKGKMSYVQEGGQTVPLLEATHIEETTAPDDAMMY
jgi:uncharacterized membrane protein YcgQ (UPF0703/DUF1980 family)